MRPGAIIAAGFGLAVLTATAAWAAEIPRSPAADAALAAGDLHQAALLGASAAEIVRTEQARGRLPDVDPETAVLIIAPDGTIASTFPVKPLPPLTDLPADALTLSLGSNLENGFQQRGVPPTTITLRPPYAGGLTVLDAPPGTFPPPPCDRLAIQSSIPCAAP